MLYNEAVWYLEIIFKFFVKQYIRLCKIIPLSIQQSGFQIKYSNISNIILLLKNNNKGILKINLKNDIYSLKVILVKKKKYCSMYEPYDNFLRVLITVLFETQWEKAKMGSFTNIVHVNDQTHIFYRTGLYLKNSCGIWRYSWK